MQFLDIHVGRNSRYDIFKNQWLPMRPMFFPKASFGVTVSQKKISVLGGEDEFDFKAGYERYNPLSNSWHCKTNMNVRIFFIVS